MIGETDEEIVARTPTVSFVTRLLQRRLQKMEAGKIVENGSGSDGSVKAAGGQERPGKRRQA